MEATSNEETKVSYQVDGYHDSLEASVHDVPCPNTVAKMNSEVLKRVLDETTDNVNVKRQNTANSKHSSQGKKRLNESKGPDKPEKRSKRTLENSKSRNTPKKVSVYR